MSKVTEDPSDKLDDVLKWHLHLVSSFKCEDKGDVFSFSHDQIKELLQEAAEAKKTTERPCAWSWQKLDLPRDRTSLIVWQSGRLPAATPYRPNQQQPHIVVPPDHFPTDGYAWGDPEELREETLGEFVLESRRHRSGFVPSLSSLEPRARNKRAQVHGVEQFTVHARTRYRLRPADAKSGSASSCDPNLWLVLYKRAERQCILPVASEAIQQGAVTQIEALAQRDEVFGRVSKSREEFSVFDRGLDIKQKGFVWANRESWPSINARHENSFHPGNAYNHIGRGNQGMYLAGQQMLDQRGQPASKRARNNQSQPVATPFMFPEGEDDGGKDMMDVLTPREISINRYRQHTEWMEELFVSPFPIYKIRPVSLGLGRTGQLSTIGDGTEFVDSPYRLGDDTAIKQPSTEQYNLYMKQAEDRIAEMKAEIEKEKALHEKRMAKIRQSGAIQDAERKLRGAVQFPPHAASKVERTEPAHAPGGKDVDVAMLRQIDDVKHIAEDVEKVLGRKIEVTEKAKCISRGGLEEKAPTPAAQQDVLMEGTDDPAQAAMARASTDGFVNAQGGLGLGQDQPGDSLALPDEDFEMVDKDDILGDASIDALGGEASMQGASMSAPGLGDPGVGETGTPGEDFSAQFLDLPDDNMGGTPGDEFGTSAFDDAFDGAGHVEGDGNHE